MDVVAAAAQACDCCMACLQCCIRVSDLDHTQAAEEPQPCDERWLACGASAVAADLQATTHVSSSAKSSPETALVSKTVTRPGDMACTCARVRENIPSGCKSFLDGGQKAGPWCEE